MIAHAHSRMTNRLVDALYVEAMLLADEARSYFDADGRAERDTLPPALRVGFSCESLRVTTRLMYVIAWLLTHRAVAAGEISAAQAGAPERRLGRAPEIDAELVDRLPQQARQIIAATCDLYDRVRRLDDSLETPPRSAARGLMDRLERAF
jgi:regulator of CtrA degradation